MNELLREYGPAIGPALAFLFGFFTLLIKQFSRRDADRRVQRILELNKKSPPPQFEGPPAALSHTEDVLTNMANMREFFDRVTLIKAAIDASEKIVHEHGKALTILKYQQIRRNLDIVIAEQAHFRGTKQQPIPLEENFFNIERSWRAALEVPSLKTLTPSYRTVPSTQGLKRRPLGAGADFGPASDTLTFTFVAWAETAQLGTWGGQ